MNQKRNIIHARLEAVEESHILQLSRNPESIIWIQNEINEQTQTLEIPDAIFPGSFNPLHEGHLKLKVVAEEILECNVGFEISIRNIDKPVLHHSVITRQLSQFTSGHLILTNAPTFLEKAELFPGTVFIVGVDTAERILNPRFYHDEQDQLLNSLNKLQELDCRFLVAARRVNQQILELKDLSIPNSLDHLFESIPKNLFYYDISSTGIRDNNDKPS